MFIGIGLGFSLDSLFTVEGGEIKFEKTFKIGSLALMIIGLIFIVGDGLYIVNPVLLENIGDILIGLGFIAVGILILLAGYKLFLKYSNSTLNYYLAYYLYFR